MRFQKTENKPAMAVIHTHLPSYTVAFLGGLFAVIATFVIFGSGHRPVTVWPVSGIIIALCLPSAPARFSSRLPLCFAGGFGVLLGTILSGLSWKVAALLAGVTSIDLAFICFLVCPYVRTFDDLRKFRNGLRLVIASIAGPLLTGFLGALYGAVFFKASSTVLMTGMSSLADAIGVAMFVPLVIFVTTGRKIQRKVPVTSLPWILSFTFFAIVCGGAFWQDTGPYLFLIFPPMMVLLLTAGLEGALFSSILIATVGSFATAHGHGPICLVRTLSPEVRVLTLQIFIWISVVTSLPVAAALDERRTAELTATTSRHVQQIILKHSREAIIMSSLDGLDRYASPAIEQLTGWTAAEYLTFARMDLVHPDDHPRVTEMLKSLACGTRETLFRYRLLHKDGRWNWVEASISAYGEEDHKVTRYVGTVRDISRLIETELGWIEERRVFSQEQQRLAEAENAARFQLKLRDEFLSHVSHELRSPLTSIYSFSSIMADGLAGPTTSEQDQYLGIVLKNALQLQSMIEDLLTVTHSGEGKLSIEQQSTSITEAIADALDTLRGFAHRKHIVLDADTLNEVSLVFADPTRLRQILIILLDNAMKFTHEGGRVQVKVAPYSADFLVIKVIDTGCGIPKDKWGAIFEKLYQIEGPCQQDTQANGRTGLGLGLHIARSLVVSHSGNIWVTSKPGEGSVFQFTMPIDKRRAEDVETIDAGVLERVS